MDEEQQQLNPSGPPPDTVYHKETRWSATPKLISHHDVAFAEKTRTSFSLLALIINPRIDFIPPTLYLKAAGEGLFLTLLLSWLLTWIFQPHIIEKNPLKDRLGYNNVCIGWDVPPANYVASVLWIPVAYLALRFCFMVSVRFSLDPGSSRFMHYANVSFAVAVCLFTLCLVIPPTTSVWGHTLPFCSYIVARFLVVYALALKEWDTMSLGDHCFIYYYGFVSVVLPIIYLSEFTYYAMAGVKSPWPWILTFVLDYSWFACLALTSKVLPSNIIVHRVMELVDLNHLPLSSEHASN